MSRQRVHWPEPLSDWIDRNMPALGGVRTVRLYAGPTLPLEWAFRSSKASAATLLGRVYLRISNGQPDFEVLSILERLFHELSHVEEQRILPMLATPLYVLRLLRFGYWHHPSEIKARQRAHELIVAYAKECKA